MNAIKYTDETIYFFYDKDTHEEYFVYESNMYKYLAL